MWTWKSAISAVRASLPPIRTSLYLQAYQFVEHGNWEGFFTVLPDHKWYPDVLVSFRDPFSAAHRPVGAPFAIRIENGPNQGVWINVYIPRTAKPGTYEAPLLVKVGRDIPAMLRGARNVYVDPHTLVGAVLGPDGEGRAYGVQR